ncbi:hypothetical protein WJX84_002858 [Apatococcus fuscideae]|uniref:Methyltransferase small domain-containing protein n=1 Tax=Apatococcus fuscideae TaxID=2026836 RepID=A0AAW1TDD6_9CHLO
MRTASIALTCYDRDVYEPSDDTFLLVDALLKASGSWHAQQRKLCLEVGCGSGFVSCSLALILSQLHVSHHLIALDISHAAISATKSTLNAHKVSTADLIQGDFQHILADTSTFDIVIFNPPYVPTPDEELERTDIARAWAGGWNGRAVIDKFLPLVPKILSEVGELLLVVVSENDPPGILKALHAMDRSLHGGVMMTRRADEELLSILHVQRR